MRLFDRRKRKSEETAAETAPAEPVAHVRIDSHQYPVTELDNTTLTIAGYSGDLIARQRFQFSFRFKLGDEPVEVPTSGIVLSTDGGKLVARYYRPQPYYQKLMRKGLGAKAA